MLGAYTPRLPLRVRPDVMTKLLLGPRCLGRDCRDGADCRRGMSSRVLELVDALIMLLMLEVELRVGVRDGSGSSPPRIYGLG